jgi:hypothetical protein
VFDEPLIHEEHHPYGMGYASETFACCPYCKGDFDKTKNCEICGEDFFEDELFGDVCEDCIQQYENDIQGCYELSQNETEEISINAFLCEMFTTQEIEELLLRELIGSNASCKKFIESDKIRFGELLLEKEKKNENK